MVDDMEKEDGQLVIDREGGRRDGTRYLYFSLVGPGQMKAQLFNLHMETHFQNDNFIT